jgi:tetratricopeptide (TPR) repeat protein
LNNKKSIEIIKKVGLGAYLFLFSFFAAALPIDGAWQFDSELQKIYQLVINLQTDKADALLKDIHTNELHKIYVQSFNETLHILITEDHKKFAQIDQSFKERVKYIESLPVSAETLFLQAELALQKGFCYLNLGQEINAVLSIRKAYQLAADCMRRYPDFIPVRKTSGVIQVMVGTVPEKYQWFMSLLGMRGTVAAGQKQLTELKNSKSSLSSEATILLYTIKGFINQQFKESADGISAILKDQPDNRLLLFIGVNMLVKDARSEEALHLIREIDRQTTGLPMPYIDYLHAEILLQKGDYKNAVAHYERFIRSFPSHSFKKDAYYKIALCHWLQYDVAAANANFEKAKVTGTDKAEPDRYAARQLETGEFPNRKLLQVRFSTDGGYYEMATQQLSSISPAGLKSIKDQTEYYYRKARLAHHLGEIADAKIFYQQSIDMTNDNPWYFGANSALNMGYIAKAQKDYDSARKYFQLALSFPKHEYKNSIDSKARTELEWLAQLKS